MRITGIIILQLLFMAVSFGQAPKAYTLIVGLKEVNGAAYLSKYKKTYSKSGTAGVDIDCDIIRRRAEDNQHNITVLRDKAATKGKILSTLEEIGKKINLEKGKVLFTFYFTGHGDTIRDINNDEASGYDQALVAYDDFVLDDDIYAILRKYFTQSYNVMMVDACHSGSMYKLFKMLDFEKSVQKNSQFQNEKIADKQQLDLLSCDFNKNTDVDEPFSLIYLGASNDDQTAMGNSFGSSFTVYLDKVISDAEYFGGWQILTYKELACRISYYLSDQQSVMYKEIGKNVNQYNNYIPFKTNEL
ncbi:MAG: caspase family protein [Chitinophagales bacterium]